ncbi:MAG: hypothetical protein V1859_03495 [archaeon]
MDAIVFQHSKGAHTRRKIIQALYKQERENFLHCAATLCGDFEISNAAIKKHIDYLSLEGYVEKINPEGKPIFLKLSEKGNVAAKKYILL